MAKKIKSNRSVKVNKHWAITDSARAAPPKPRGAPLSISMTPDANNPLTVQGTVAGYDAANTAITVWLTDQNGDPYFGALNPNPPNLPNWTATFVQMPAGEYTLTAQVQSDNEIASQSCIVNLQDPVAPPPPPPPPPPSPG